MQVTCLVCRAPLRPVARYCSACGHPAGGTTPLSTFQQHRAFRSAGVIGAMMIGGLLTLILPKIALKIGTDSKLDVTGKDHTQTAAGRLCLSPRTTMGRKDGSPPPRLCSPTQPPAVGDLIALLSHKDHDVRRKAASILEYLRDSRTLVSLVDALSDDDPIVRSHAASALGALRNPEAVEFLRRCLNDQAWCVRYAAVLALHEIGDPRAIPALTPLTKDPSSELAQQAVAAIRHLSSGGADRGPDSGLIARR